VDQHILVVQHRQVTHRVDILHTIIKDTVRLVQVVQAGISMDIEVQMEDQAWLSLRNISNK
jgi:hypothetical protein